MFILSFWSRSPFPKIAKADLNQWILRTSGTSNTLHGVAYGNNTLVAVGDAGTILTSPNGVTWTTRTSGTSNVLFGVAYGSNSFVFPQNQIYKLCVFPVIINS